MRKIGFLGLLLAVASIMAVAASSASADVVLCETSTNPCPEGKRYPPTAIKAKLQTGTTTSFVSGFISVNCTGSSLENVTTKQSGVTIPGQFNFTSFTGCASSGGNACRMNNYYSSYWAPPSYINGTGQIVAPEGKNGVWLNCGPENEPSYWCFYTAKPPMTMQIAGGSPATITASKISLERKDELSYILCSKTATLSGSYTVTSPNPLYVGTL